MVPLISPTKRTTWQILQFQGSFSDGENRWIYLLNVKTLLNPQYLPPPFLLPPLKKMFLDENKKKRAFYQPEIFLPATGFSNLVLCF